MGSVQTFPYITIALPFPLLVILCHSFMIQCHSLMTQCKHTKGPFCNCPLLVIVDLFLYFLWTFWFAAYQKGPLGHRGRHKLCFRLTWLTSLTQGPLKLTDWPQSHFRSFYIILGHFWVILTPKVLLQQVMQCHSCDFFDKGIDLLVFCGLIVRSKALTWQKGLTSHS